MNKIGFILASALLALAIMSSTVFVVDQRQYGVVYTMAEIKEVITEPGLHFKLPQPFQSVTLLDRRIYTLDSPETRAIQTAEKKNLVIDWLVKWRITDPKQFIRNNNGSELSTAETRLSSLVQASLNDEVTRRTVKDVLSSEREKIMQGVKNRLADEAKAFGIQIVDVRIKRVDFPSSVAESVYRRMESERKQEAVRLRNTGAAEGERIKADAEKQRDVIVANAYRDAQKVKGEGDGEATRIYGDSFGRDPAFARYYRALEACKSSFSKKSDVLVIEPGTDPCKAFKGAAAIDK